MLFRKYQVIILSQSQDKQRTFSVRCIWLLLACILFIVLAVGNYGFLQYYKATQYLPQELLDAEERIASQRVQILALAKKAQRIDDDLARVQNFDASLRLMVDMNNSVPKALNMELAENTRKHANTDGQASSSQASVAHDDSKEGDRDLESSFKPQFKLTDATSLGLGTLPLHRQELLTRKIHAFLDSLSTATELEEVQQQELIIAIRHQQDFLATTPSIWPTKGKLTSPFGWRSSPTSGASTFHKGIDIGKNNGAPIVAPADGTVTFVGRQRGYGNCVEIRHANDISTMYAHMRSYTVKRDQQVKRNDVIGYVGSTGRSTGPHLHYEVRVHGVPVDPMKYILN